MRRTFFRFNLRQLCLLLIAVSLLLGLTGHRLRDAHRTRRREQAFRTWKEAQIELASAMDRNDVKLARQALDSGAKANWFHADKPLLQTCMENGQLEIVELLLDYDADVERSAQLKNSLVTDAPPLFTAIGCNQPTEIRQQFVRLLVGRGADPLMKIGKTDLMDMCVYHADPMIADFLVGYGLDYGAREMASFNRLDELRRLVEENPSVVHERCEPIYAAGPGQEPTLLGIALREGHREMALFLMAEGARVDTVENLGQTLMHAAARGGCPELISILATRGLDVNARDKYQDTPLTDCASYASQEVISALLNAGADVNSRGMNGKTAIHLALTGGKAEVIRVLLSAGADPTIPDDSGKSSLDEAQEKHPDIHKLLLQPR